MTINYKKTYLTDGTQVKITHELFNQLKQWEEEGYNIPYSYIDILKQEDNKMINTNRNYSIHNISLDEQLLKRNANPTLMLDENSDTEMEYMRIELKRNVMKVLNFCTETQRRRFIKYYYLGFNKSEIASQEGCYESAVRNSIKKAEKLIIFHKNSF